MRIVVWEAFIELCRSNVEVLLGAFCVAGRTFYLRFISVNEEATVMSEEKCIADSEALSDGMITWLLLLKKLDESITDPEIYEAFHRFVQIDNDLLHESIEKAYRRGYAAGKAAKTE